MRNIISNSQHLKRITPIKCFKRICKTKGFDLFKQAFFSKYRPIDFSFFVDHKHVIVDSDSYQAQDNISVKCICYIRLVLFEEYD
jgi:hypothetical protein